MKLHLTVPITLLMLAWVAQTIALDLELIYMVEGDTVTEDMGYGVQSPGDLDGDGFSEVFVGAKKLGIRKTRVFNGGNPADGIPERVFLGSSGTRIAWVDDISGDGIKDFALPEWDYGYGDTSLINIYYGGADFYSKPAPDVILREPINQGWGMHIFSEDADADGYVELIIAAPNASDVDCRFHIYETHPDFDSLADDSLNIPGGGYNNTTTAACLGDINSDGFADYATASYVRHTPGYALIFLGSEPLNFIHDQQLWSPFDSTSGPGHFGYWVYPADDLNRDGFDDFIVTSAGYPPCIYYGSDPFDTIPKILQYPGRIASTCGDINNDGWTDIAIGDIDHDLDYGRIFVYFGAEDMDTIADISINWNELPFLAYQFGQSIGSAGDFNGDGIDDLAVGAGSSYIDNWNTGRLIVFAGFDSGTAAGEIENEESLPETYNVLRQNYPNPFNHKTTIRYNLFGHFERQVEFLVYNILGEHIRTLASARQSGGDHVTWWDGTDNNGDTVPSGIYFYVLKADGQRIVKKMLFLK